MTRFRFNHLTYEVPPDIDIFVRTVEGSGGNEFFDYDFVKDGMIVAIWGGVDEDGQPLPTWEDVGIRQVERLRILDPIELDIDGNETQRLDTLEGPRWPLP